MLDEKYAQLQELVNDHDRVVVAFSGGVDSTLLTKVCTDELGEDAIAVTVDSGLVARSELEKAREMSQEIEARHLVVEDDFLEMNRFVENPPDKCYLCKKRMISHLTQIASEMDADGVFDGTNHDDYSKDRPGLEAIKEEEMISPLGEVGFTKNDIRALARELGLSNHKKFSNTCLATRLPYGRRITHDKLEAIEEAEEVLREMGIKQIRVRYHGHIARIEALKKDFPIIVEKSDYIVKEFKKVGFSYVNLDLTSYGR